MTRFNRRTVGAVLLVPVAVLEGIIQWVPGEWPGGTYLAIALLLLGAVLGLRVMIPVVVGFLAASLSARTEGAEIFILLMPFFSIPALAGVLSAALVKSFASRFR